MAHNKLQIKLLSKSGELLRCINCFAGQVTVLRGYSSAELQPYQRLFAGVQGPEKLVATIDGEPYDRSKAILIGFGDSFEPGKSVEQYLTEAGIPETAIQMNLMNYGIEVDPGSLCEKLSADFRRRLRLLAALNSSDRILVLNNPFEDISSGWRERFAEEIVFFARNKNQIVVVPSLNYRPEGWINNDQISRMQVGENSQRTIGFGSEPTQMNDLVSQLRQAFDSEESAKAALENIQQPRPARQTTSPAQANEAAKKKAPPSTREEVAASAADSPPTRAARTVPGVLLPMLQSINSRLPSGRTPLVIGSVLAVVVAGLFGVLMNTDGGNDTRMAKQLSNNSSQKTSKRGKAAVETATATKSVAKEIPDAFRDLTPPSKTSESSKDSNKRVKPAVAREIAPEPPRRNDDPPGNFVLDLYPASVRTSVLRAFNADIASSAPVPARQSGEKKTEKGDDLFSLLETTSGTGKDLPPTKTVTSSSNSSKKSSTRRPGQTLSREEIEERRKRIRQKFLEAIERRAKQRGL